jgi:RimJ/RimL family protein N-acetyltransferase
MPEPSFSPAREAANTAEVLAVLSDRFKLPLDRLRPGRVLIVEAPADARIPVRAYLREGGAVVSVRPDAAHLVGDRLDDAATVRRGLEEIAADLPGRVLTAVTRSGTAVVEPAAEIVTMDTGDPRLPEWVHGHFNGTAWTVLGPDGDVLSNAVLKDYDDRLREIAVGTTERARGRGLARAVTAAAARATLDGGRVVLYMHDEHNDASAKVAQAAGLLELGRLASIVPERAIGTEPPPDGVDRD